MEFKCIICGSFICTLDLRNPENKEESLDISYCNKCTKDKIHFTRKLFSEY